MTEYLIQNPANMLTPLRPALTYKSIDDSICCSKGMVTLSTPAKIIKAIANPTSSLFINPAIFRALRLSLMGLSLRQPEVQQMILTKRITD